MNTWNIQWKNPWKKTIALGSAAFLLGGSAVYAASPVTQTGGSANVQNVQDAPMPLPLTEEETEELARSPYSPFCVQDFARDFIEQKEIDATALPSAAPVRLGGYGT